MKIYWNGHSCFTIETQGGTVVLDPYGTDSVPGLHPLALEGDLVLCSHGHRDHNAVGAVKLSGKTVDLQIETLSSYHDPVQGAKRGPNTIHILTAEGLRVAHLGDLGCELTADQKDKLRNLDAMLVPVGGFFTIDAVQAKALVDELKPRVVIPMHFRTDRYGYDATGRVEDYLVLADHVVRYSGNTLELTANTPAQTAALTYEP